MKWGIWATGNIAHKFAKTVNMMQKAGENQKIIACASRNEENARAFAKEFDIEKAYAPYELMLDDKEVEAVYIATPNNMHYENCMASLKAGKHVLCEKPFTLKAEEARELYDYAAANKLFIMEGMWIRFLPALRRMQELIKDGEIGEVIHARSDYGFIAKGARRERKFLKELGGGALLDIGIYNLAFMRMVMGDQNITGCSCKYHLNEYGTDDFSTMLLEYDKKTATIVTSIGMDIPRKAAIYGTKGAIYLDDFQHADELTVCPFDKEEYSLSFPISMGGFEYEIRHMSSCIDRGLSTSDYLKKEDTLEILGFMEKQIQEF